MERNNVISESIVLWCFILLTVCLVIPLAHASNDTPETSVAYNSTNAIERITQGQCVELGRAYDITGVIGWSDKFAYYGRYDTDLSPENGTYDVQTVIEHPMTVRGLSRYYIDPTYFENRIGMWYQVSDALSQSTRFEVNGNLQAFRVNYTCPANQPIKPTIAQQSVNITANKTYLPLTSVHVADILVARGDAVYFQANDTSYAWIFGTNYNLYNVKMVDNHLWLKPEEVQKFPPGEYKVVILNSGKNGIIEASFDTATENITSPFRNTPPIATRGIAPTVTYVKFVKWLQEYSDDKITILTMQVQEPYTDVRDVEVDSPLSNYGIDIDGYTNLDMHNQIYAVIDEDKNGNLATKYPGAILEDTKGNMNQFIIKIPIDINSLPATSDPIELSIHTGESRTNVPFWIYDLPEGQKVPEQHNKYLGGNLYVPTPTPIVITLPSPTPIVVTQTVTITVPVTPTDQQVGKATFESMVTLAAMCIVGTIFVCVGIYVVSAWTRRKHDN